MKYIFLIFTLHFIIFQSQHLKQKDKIIKTPPVHQLKLLLKKAPPPPQKGPVSPAPPAKPTPPAAPTTSAAKPATPVQNTGTSTTNTNNSATTGSKGLTQTGNPNPIRSFTERLWFSKGICRYLCYGLIILNAL